MELEEAKEIIDDCIEWDTFGRSVRSKKNKLDNKCFKALEIVMKEYNRLQKENEELKEIDLTTVHIKGVCDEKERWRNKIKDLIERLNKNELLNKYNYEQMKIAIDILQDLLKEE